MPLSSIFWSFSFGIFFRDSLVSCPEKSYFKVYFFGQCLFSSLGSAFCSKLLLMSAIVPSDGGFTGDEQVLERTLRLAIQLTLEQHGFELHGSIYI